MPRYPEYKDSGVEWLGAVPAKWTVCKLGYQLSESPCYGVLVPDFDPDGVPMLKIMDMQAGFANRDMLTTISVELSSEYSRTITKSGDVLLSVVGTIGEVLVVNEQLEGINLSRAIARIQPGERLDRSFLSWLLRSKPFDNYVDLTCVGSAQRVLNMADLSAFKIAIPGRTEQLAIANFLGAETAKIDALVAEQEKLIALLKEKRQAVISHAVTEGLDPGVPMKDSGIEWLGEVPAHWSVMPLKRDLVFLTSGSRGWADHYSDDGALFIRIGNLTRDSIHLDLSDIQRVAVPDGTEGERTRVRPGDVMFSITAYLGSVAVAPPSLETAYVSQHVALARLGQRYLAPEWVGYVSLSVVGKTYLETQGYGGTKIQLSLDDVANLLMTVPPIEEQNAIVTFLDSETTKFDALAAEAEHAIELLKERRSVLISAAVTGKIDVRRQVAEREAA